MAESVVARTSAQSPAPLTFRPTGWSTYAYSVDGALPASGALLSVHAAARLDEINVSASTGGVSGGFRLSAADARSLAVQLLAAADAVDAVQGRA